MDLTNTSVKLQSRYASYTTNRPKTILLTNEQFYQIHQPPSRPVATPQTPTVKKCRATKLDGCRCDAVVKIAGDFCKRHAKSNK
jgi:hypothetical protein